MMICVPYKNGSENALQFTLSCVALAFLHLFDFAWAPDNTLYSRDI